MPGTVSLRHILSPKRVLFLFLIALTDNNLFKIILMNTYLQEKRVEATDEEQKERHIMIILLS